MIGDAEIWAVIVLLGIGSYALRFVFVGLVGGRPIPAWLLRHLRYTAVGILPALVAPLVVWPEATGGTLDGPRQAAALVVLAVGYVTHNMILAIIAGGVTLYGGLLIFG
jgi:branched-subunit amino acid transport protein